MWGCSRRVLQEVVSPRVRCFSQTPCKNTVVVERWWKVPLAKEGQSARLHPRRHRIYKLVDAPNLGQKEKYMDLILTETVEKLGGRGETVRVKKSFGRSKLLAQHRAVYPSPENKEMFAEEMRILREGNPDDRVQTRTGQLTVDLLKHSDLKINKWPSGEYTLTKEIACRQFARKLGVIVPLHALTLPDEPIHDVGEYWCDVMVNGIDTVRVPVQVLPYEDPSAEAQKMLKALRLKAEAEAAEASPQTTTLDDEAAASPEPPTENRPKD